LELLSRFDTKSVSLASGAPTIDVGTDPTLSHLALIVDAV
jgi:hypothetical protein